MIISTAMINLLIFEKVYTNYKQTLLNCVGSRYWRYERSYHKKYLEAVDEMIKEFGHEGGCFLGYLLPEWMVFSVET